MLMKSINEFASVWEYNDYYMNVYQKKYAYAEENGICEEFDDTPKSTEVYQNEFKRGVF